MKCLTGNFIQLYSRLTTVSLRSSMALTILRRISLLRSTTDLLLSLQQRSRFSTSRASTFVHDDRRRSVNNRIQLSPLFQETGADGIKDCKIELVDDSTWNVSSSLPDAWRSSNEVAASRMTSSFSDDDGDHHHYNDDGAAKEDHDFDEIEDMRIRGNLFYKLDKSSKEYEEYKFDFHGSRSARNEKEQKRRKEERKKDNPTSRVEMASKKDHAREKGEEDRKELMLLGCERREKPNYQVHLVRDATSIVKKERTPTFNQLTAAYHEPFCLDVFISNASIRASIIHRATSNVVVVAHSISKDMKFDLGSTKNKKACAVVGKVLAQRALADDIHNIVYTPRKGERIEGKLQIVVKSIMDGGVDVKVKLKQKSFKHPKHLLPPTSTVIA